METHRKAEQYRSDPSYGLDACEVARRKAIGLTNVTTERVAKSTGRIVADNVCTLFNLFNAVIALALALVGAWSNMLFIVIIVANVLIGIAQELHAKHLVDELSLLSAPTVKVIREGVAAELGAGELVIDDVCELDTGHQVCADCVILTGAVEVNESLLTGESDPVRKTVEAHLLSGSFVVSGRCRALVEHVGDENYATRIAQESKKIRPTHSELLWSMERVTRFTGYFIVPLGLLLFAESFLLRSGGAASSVISTSAGLLGMLPKGLVLLMSMSLAAGVATLARRRVLVQELYSLENLAHVDTLCLDKTGTLTEGRMRVEDVRLTELGRTVPFERLMGIFMGGSVDDNATFDALRERFAAVKTETSPRSVPFSSERKWSSVECEGVMVVAGAPDRLAPQGSECDDVISSAQSSGKRVLLVGIARGPVSEEYALPKVDPLAAVVIADPIRNTASDTLAYFKQEGIDLKLISGDDPTTVSSLAMQAGFPSDSRPVDMTGVTDEDEIARLARTRSIFGRVSPQQKQRLVRALRTDGHTVAMTGDGVNDLLALREADCSIAMGGGTDAARQVSQVVLLDSDFSALPDVLGQGRRVVNTITRIAGVFFVKTVYSVLLSLTCLVLNVPFPFAPLQITLIDLVIEGYPAFFMSFEPDTAKVVGHFLPSALERAIPNAVSFMSCFLMVLPLSTFLGLPESQERTLLYLLVGTVGIQAVLKASWPFNPLRVFLCVTMTVSFFAAVALFHGTLGVASPEGITFALFAALAIASVAGERVMTMLIERLDPFGAAGAQTVADRSATSIGTRKAQSATSE